MGLAASEHEAQEAGGTSSACHVSSRVTDCYMEYSQTARLSAAAYLYELVLGENISRAKARTGFAFV